MAEAEKVLNPPRSAYTDSVADQQQTNKEAHASK
jgi:hypothetical protein